MDDQDIDAFLRELSNRDDASTRRKHHGVTPVTRIRSTEANDASLDTLLDACLEEVGKLCDGPVHVRSVRDNIGYASLVPSTPTESKNMQVGRKQKYGILYRTAAEAGLSKPPLPHV
ncbi:hypothetical protein HDU83_001363 [Entophlyctis luteolus]|nr:hypothetical protein HDU83_001363 [Entophlyctis luteolus]